MALTAERLRSLLHYDPATGIFTWLVTRGRLAKAGDVAGSPNSEGYIEIKIDGTSYKAHRLAWLYTTGEWPAHQVDHRDNNQANNRWLNLREATHAQNRQNSRRQRNNTSGITGVVWHKPSRKWCAQIGIGKADVRKTINLGYFATIEEAAAVRRAAEINHFGAFAPAQ